MQLGFMDLHCVHNDGGFMERSKATRQSMPLVGEIGSPRYVRDDKKRYFGNFQLPYYAIFNPKD